jgi:hypothetical protein
MLIKFILGLLTYAIGVYCGLAVVWWALKRSRSFRRELGKWFAEIDGTGTPLAKIIPAGHMTRFQVRYYLKDPDVTHLQFEREEIEKILQEIPEWLIDAERRPAMEVPYVWAQRMQDYHPCNCYACRCIRGRRKVGYV